MQICQRCHIQIRGNKRMCPLCGGPLLGEPEEPAYPAKPRKKMSRLTAVRLSGFLLLSFAAVMAALILLTGHVLPWQPLAAISALVCFLDICVTVYYRTNVLKTLSVQTVMGMVLCMVVDYFTHWHGWSVIWVLPCGFVALIIATIAVGGGMHMMLQDFVLYILFDVVLSSLQVLLIWTGKNPFPRPAELSMLAVLLFFIGILIFRGKELRSATKRYFNV